MSLDHAILGFLDRQSLSGYDLKKAFDASVRHFWPADQSHIYRTLARLVEKGWADREVIPQEDRPARKVYTITPSGSAEFRRWMTEPPPACDGRTQLIQVFFASVLTDDEALDMFRRARRNMQEELKAYEGILDKSKAELGDQPLTKEWFFGLSTLEYGFASTRGSLIWIESVIERLKNKDYTLRDF